MTQSHFQSDKTRAGHAPGYQFPPRIGPWELVRPLQLGRVTATFLARPAGSKDQPCQYVAKLLATEHADLPQYVELLQREAEVGRKVCHAHLVSVLDASIVNRPHDLLQASVDLAAGPPHMRRVL